MPDQQLKHMHARTPRIYKVSVVIKMKLTLSAASLGTEAGTYASLSLHAHAQVCTHICMHTHTHARTKTLISFLLQVPFMFTMLLIK